MTDTITKLLIPTALASGIVIGAFLAAPRDEIKGVLRLAVAEAVLVALLWAVIL